MLIIFRHFFLLQRNTLSHEDSLFILYFIRRAPINKKVQQYYFYIL